MDIDTHYIKPDCDCMGNPTPGYWRCFMSCSDGRVVIGVGAGQAESMTIAQAKHDERETYLRLSAVDRLKILLEGDLLSTESKEAMKIIGKLVLTLCDRFGSEPR